MRAILRTTYTTTTYENKIPLENVKANGYAK